MSTSNMFNQPTYNVGFLGHVSHGKTTTIRALTGIETYKYSKEKERGITIKIGYANCKIFKCCCCPEPKCYFAKGSSTKILQCPNCDSDTALVQYLSFIDCPGHESLMNTMLSGTTVMDYAILLIDGTQKCPQPQTIEHLAALEILQIKKIIVLQNKLDLIDSIIALEQYNNILNFLKGTCAESAPIIPFSAQKKFNIDILCEYMIKYFGNVDRTKVTTKMNIIRSFDVNKPGSEIDKLKGGVLGGTIISGELRIGDIIEIRPGLIQKNNNHEFTWKPIITEITSMKSDSDNLDVAHPGGLIGICTNLDPVLTRSDRMVGQVIGLPDKMPNVFVEIVSKCVFMSRAELSGLNETPIKNPVKKDIVLLNISSKSVMATVKHVSGTKYMFSLKIPCCMDVHEKFSISTKINNSWRLIGMGKLLK